MVGKKVLKVGVVSRKMPVFVVWFFLSSFFGLSPSSLMNTHLNVQL